MQRAVVGISALGYRLIEALLPIAWATLLEIGRMQLSQRLSNGPTVSYIDGTLGGNYGY